ncbi:uncharacterized protein K441DRAFT_670004 [Cenococcum geophilum 1.58]|uniref:Uncharacterized protein n=1 Tax=Cenococcum geophilum 1.58 TaxID=794803 RepID=A0ACC8ENK5_9PEZI|nr:hypothetical protein K441DRAFT_670004 [Cenococcum geophilum 1.58]
MSSGQSHRLVLISHPRTASNLLIKILNIDEQHEILPSSRRTGHIFYPAIKVKFEHGLQAKRVCDWSEEERSTMIQTNQERLNELDEYATRAKNEGKIAFFRDHSISLADPVAQTRFYVGEDSVQEIPWPVKGAGSHGALRTSLNNTLLPDEFLKSWRPTFVIRHPALVFPSYCRVLDAADSSEDEMVREGALVNTYHWTRSLYDCYKNAFAIDGIILDAEDIISKPEVLFHYCEKVGIDSSKLRFTWDAKSTIEELAQNKVRDLQHRPFMATMDASSGILQDKAPSHIDIDLEAKKWREEFGERAGAKLEEWVRAAIPDYEYLSSRRLRAKGEGDYSGIKLGGLP